MLTKATSPPGMLPSVTNGTERRALGVLTRGPLCVGTPHGAKATRVTVTGRSPRVCPAEKWCPNPRPGLGSQEGSCHLNVRVSFHAQQPVPIATSPVTAR